MNINNYFIYQNKEQAISDGQLDGKLLNQNEQIASSIQLKVDQGMRSLFEKLKSIVDKDNYANPGKKVKELKNLSDHLYYLHSYIQAVRSHLDQKGDFLRKEDKEIEKYRERAIFYKNFYKNEAN